MISRPPTHEALRRLVSEIDSLAATISRVRLVMIAALLAFFVVVGLEIR